MQETLQAIIEFIKVNPVGVAIAVGATAASLIALYLVFSRNRNISARRDVVIGSTEVTTTIDKLHNEYLQIAVEKSFIKSTIGEFVQKNVERPRFTFAEFISYGMPALITLFLLGLSGYLITNRLPLDDFIKQGFTAILAYYFGVATASKVR